MALTPCSACQRHFKAGEARCPFCQAAARTRPRVFKMRHKLLVGGTLLLVSCAPAPEPVPVYGAPAPPETPTPSPSATP